MIIWGIGFPLILLAFMIGVKWAIGPTPKWMKADYWKFWK